EEELVQNRLDVEACPPRQDREFPPPVNLLDRLVGQLLVLGYVETLVGLDDVDKVMGHPFPLGGGRLVGADVEALVHLHGVGSHHFASEAQGELDGNLGLAHRGWPHDDDQGIFILILSAPFCLSLVDLSWPFLLHSPTPLWFPAGRRRPGGRKSKCGFFSRPRPRQNGHWWRRDRRGGL